MMAPLVDWLVDPRRWQPIVYWRESDAPLVLESAPGWTIVWAVTGAAPTNSTFLVERQAPTYLVGRTGGRFRSTDLGVISSFPVASAYLNVAPGLLNVGQRAPSKRWPVSIPAGVLVYPRVLSPAEQARAQDWLLQQIT